jgi:hypothetical protein
MEYTCGNSYYLDLYGSQYKVGSLAKAKIVGKKVIPTNYLGYCRESFHSSWYGAGYKKGPFFFYHVPSERARIQLFLNEVEERLGLKNKSQVCSVKGRDSFSVICPSAWWQQNEIRRQFLTILLRCGRNYGKKDYATFNKTLFSTPYTRRTPKAVRQFLKGKTKLDSSIRISHEGRNQSNKFQGWVKFFGGKQTGIKFLKK